MPIIRKHHVHPYSNAVFSIAIIGGTYCWDADHAYHFRERATVLVINIYRTPVSGVLRRKDSGFAVCGENLAGVSRFVAGIRHSSRMLRSLCKNERQLMSQKETLLSGAAGRRARNNSTHCFLPIWKEGAATQRFRRGSGPPEKVFNELWKPSRGRLGARRDCKVLDDHKAVDLSLQVGV